MFGIKQPGLKRPPKDEEDNEWCHDRFAIIDRSESPHHARRVGHLDLRTATTSAATALFLVSTKLERHSTKIEKKPGKPESEIVKPGTESLRHIALDASNHPTLVLGVAARLDTVESQGAVAVIEEDN